MDRYIGIYIRVKWPLHELYSWLVSLLDTRIVKAAVGRFVVIAITAIVARHILKSDTAFPYLDSRYSISSCNSRVNHNSKKNFELADIIAYHEAGGRYALSKATAAGSLCRNHYTRPVYNRNLSKASFCFPAFSSLIAVFKGMYLVGKEVAFFYQIATNCHKAAR